MFLAKVAVNSHRECSAILVPKPSANGGDIDACLDAGGGKEVPEIVVSEWGILKSVARRRNASLRLSRRADSVGHLGPLLRFQP